VCQDFGQGSARRDSADGQHALEHGKSDELFQHALFRDDKDGNVFFRPGQERGLEIRQPLVGKQD
jgi:hypothetical protein